eukprot:m.104310 g.104310  ORF g.104310 m.104310 type:complete len:250 (-) comp15074_c0_seq5:1376-2125(-)
MSEKASPQYQTVRGEISFYKSASILNLTVSEYDYLLPLFGFFFTTLCRVAARSDKDNSASDTGADDDSADEDDYGDPATALAAFENDHKDLMEGLSQDSINALLAEAQRTLNETSTNTVEDAKPSERHLDSSQHPAQPETKQEEHVPSARAISAGYYTAVHDHPNIWLFSQPLDPQLVPEFYDAVQDPLDMPSIRRHLDQGRYDGKPEMLLADLRRMFDDSLNFHGRGSVFGRYAIALKEYLDVLAATD